MNTSLMEGFFICHWCRGISLRLLEKNQMALKGYLGAWKKLIHEKNRNSKILWRYPFIEKIVSKVSGAFSDVGTQLHRTKFKSL